MSFSNNKSPGSDGLTIEFYKLFWPKLKAYLMKGAKLLEIGSGPGSDYALMRNWYQLVGSDYSPAFLSKLRNVFQNSEYFFQN